MSTAAWPPDPDLSDQVITIQLNKCRCGCGQFLTPDRAWSAIVDEAREGKGHMPEPSGQVITITLKKCKCGCGQFLQPHTVGDFIDDTHRATYHNESRRKTLRRQKPTAA